MISSTTVLYLLGLAGTGIFLLMTGWATIAHRRAARRYAQYIAKMPKAVEYDRLDTLVEDRRTEWERLLVHAAGAKELIARKTEAESWLQENEARLAQIRIDQERRDVLLGELAETQKLLDERRIEFGKYKVAAEAWELKNKQLTEVHDQLVARVEQIRVTADEQDRATRTEFEAARSRLAEAERLAVDAEGRLRSLQGLVESAARDLANNKAEAQAAFESYRDGLDRQATARREELQSEINSRSDSLRNTESELIRLRAERDDALVAKNGALEEHARLSGESKSLGERVAGLRSDISRLEGEHQARTGIRPGEDDSARTADLWKQALAAPPRLSEVSAEEVKLAQVASHLEKHGLVFHERILRAFHTSLKVADISPLVVLAGISGTGKSELPRRYAEAMEMHYLALPVQPRWDSPQDMFGFYNYLENRYRATELSRALVQMDPFFAEGGRGWSSPADWQSRNGEMLLVLLDEMNLARVEYYFSEFLSRLETRRSVNRRDPASRKDAEIVLETGAGAKGATPTMRLFVDTNVLFVGTMNEDESTQTLSEKVVDRSNVLRFGRPQSLVTDRPGALNGQAAPAAPRMSHEQWRRWLRAETTWDAEVCRQVDETVQRLNEALTGIHRAFGYRSHRAIRQYVFNYPQVDGTLLWKDAFADQIEQKILPRFRGIDVGEQAAKHALDQVCEVVKELGDDQLNAAIEASIHDQQFVWAGLDRNSQFAGNQ